VATAREPTIGPDTQAAERGLGVGFGVGEDVGV
jgi:hypothetical protein